MKEALFTINVSEIWLDSEFEWHTGVIHELTDEQRREITERVFADDAPDFGDWFETHRMKDFDLVYDTIADALRGYVNHVAGDILPEKM